MQIDLSKVKWDAPPAIDPSKVQWDEAPTQYGSAVPSATPTYPDAIPEKRSFQDVLVGAGETTRAFIQGIPAGIKPSFADFEDFLRDVRNRNDSVMNREETDVALVSFFSEIEKSNS